MTAPEWFSSDLQALADRIPPLKPALEFDHLFPWNPRPTGFRTLIRIILEQQVSVKAAHALWAKLDEAYPNVTPQMLLHASDEDLAACGFSRQKRGYARGLAEAIIDRRFDPDALSDLPDREVEAAVTAHKGLGPWTAEIYLMFALGRRDVMPAGDLALQIAWMEIAGLPERPKPAILRTLLEPFAPRRTALSFLLWRHYLARQQGLLPTKA